MKIGWIIILVGLLGLIYYVSKKDKYTQYPSSYYDEGGWDTMPPQQNKCNNKESYELSTNEPAPLNLPHIHTGDLCQQCIGHCYLKVWAGVIKVPEGKNEKNFCIGKCMLECTELD